MVLPFVSDYQNINRKMVNFFQAHPMFNLVPANYKAWVRISKVNVKKKFKVQVVVSVLSSKILRYMYLINVFILFNLG